MNHSSGLNSDVSAENSANSLFPEELTSKSSNELRQTRINFIQDLRAQGINPYIGKFERDFTCYQASKTPIGQDVSVAGRVVLFRSFGKLVFGTLQDQSGRIQFSLKADTLGKDEVKRLSQLISNGDHVGIFGDIWQTQKGEITVNAKRFELLSKSLMPLPTKHEGIKDVETLQRNRPLDLISNLETRERFLARSKMISNLRHFMEEKGFIEVETPILQGAACGASAQPFTTHHNALDTDFYLRISPETYLKRVIAGGLEKVFEIGKNFRNEGTDASHLQEFTMLEWYVAYDDYRDNIKLVSEVLKFLINKHNGCLSINYQGTDLDFSGEWQALDYRKAVLQESNIDLREIKESKVLANEMHRIGVINEAELTKQSSYGSLVDTLFKRTVRNKIIQPTIVVNYPAELVPLARRNDNEPDTLDMFQVIVNTWEIVKGYSELVDPILQRKLLEDQVAQLESGDEESMMLEEDFLEAMELGMPPISGVGIGLDRFFALISNQANLKEVVLFPQVRPKKI